MLPRINLDLSHVEELVTYVGRGMEPYRGFPQFIEAVALLQQRRPNCHVVIVGEDRVAYGKKLPDGKTYKQVMLEKFPLDLSRVHFTGQLPYEEHLQVLQASSAHVYLTRPFVLSWSMLEAMSAGCLLVASNTAPVTEVIQDGGNGLLADFFSPAEIADRLEEALNHPDHLHTVRAKARETILAHYDLTKLLPQHLQWIQQDLDSHQTPLWTGTPLKPAISIAADRGQETSQDSDHSSSPEPITRASRNGSNGKHKSKKHSPLQELITISNGNRSNRKSNDKESASPSEQISIPNGNGKNSASNHLENAFLESPAISPALLQIGDRTVNATELVALLSQYQLLPKLQQESLIDDAIVPFICTPEEQEQCCQEFYTRHQLVSETDRQNWLQQQGITATQAIHLATRPLRIEKFKQATWGHTLESYFLKRKAQLDQVIYSLIRVQDAAAAQEIYFRLKADEQSFAELAQQYSQGVEARTGGLLGPVLLSHCHPKLAQLLSASKPGQLLPPIRIENVWVIVQPEKFLPAQLDAAMRQRLLDELFENWLKEQLNQLATSQIASAAAAQTTS